MALLVIGLALAGGVMGVYMILSFRQRPPVPVADQQEAVERQMIESMRKMLHAERSLEDEVTTMVVLLPDVQHVLAELAAGRCEEALRAADALAAEPQPKDVAALVRAHVLSTCGDRAGAAETLKGFLALGKNDSEFTLLTWYRLRKLGVEPPPEEAHRVLGVRVDLAYPEGLETLAAYADGSTHFFSRKGRTVLGEDHRPGVEDAARRVIAAAAAFVESAEREPRPRRPPELGTVRFTFLTPSGPWIRTSIIPELRRGDGELAPLFALMAELVLLKEARSNEGPARPEQVTAH